MVWYILLGFVQRRIIGPQKGHESMYITAVRLKHKKKMRKCLVPALALCATLAAAASRPRRRHPWAQAFDRLQPNRTVPLAGFAASRSRATALSVEAAAVHKGST